MSKVEHHYVSPDAAPELRELKMSAHTSRMCLACNLRIEGAERIDKERQYDMTMHGMVTRVDANRHTEDINNEYRVVHTSTLLAVFTNHY